MKKIAIVGGGLSGLYTAFLLEQYCDVTVFEARERLGGRIYTVDGFDLGPSWIWAHQSRILRLIRFFGLEFFSQYETGEALYETPRKIERFTPTPNPPSGRIKGGIGKLIEALVSRLNRANIHLNEPVFSLAEDRGSIVLQTHKQVYRFDEVIFTLPTRLILDSFQFEPPLSSEMIQSFESLPTWMGHSAKCVIEFETPFWREMGLSGFCFSSSGPMGEIHDACSEGRYALFGFINAQANRENIEEKIRAQCRHLFGVSGERIVNLYYVDWRNEKFTAVARDAIPPRNHPNYGLETNQSAGAIHFIGTETSCEEGGYLEGAIASVEKLFKKLING